MRGIGWEKLIGKTSKRRHNNRSTDTTQCQFTVNDAESTRPQLGWNRLAQLFETRYDSGGGDPVFGRGGSRKNRNEEDVETAIIVIG